MALPQSIVSPLEKMCMDWQQRPGAGLFNVGNSCYINVILQCLTYTPPLANYLLSSKHSQACQHQGFCMMCTMEAHVRKVLCSSASAIVPGAILKNLKFKCLSCQAVADSYEAFLDVTFDIRAASSITTLLEDCVTPQQLDQKECFTCSKCEKKAAASENATVHRAPRVLTLCLERADQQNGVKISKFVEYPEYLDLRPYMSDTAGEPLLYSLCAIVVHSGDTCLEGHFLCYTKASNGLWYKMDDDYVENCDIHTVLGQQAYLLFYTRMKVVPSQRNHARERVRSRSPQGNNDLCTINGTKSSLTTRKRKRTSPSQLQTIHTRTNMGSMDW
ncbi:ubiquitin carboxyl-terminal hydrolase 17-like [Catharus ustulatus]|uniref:ubiquitin carboxyl-terminal hydrolase 17-like n=1 Tax=Catharus ustulatus TaxID=91951 RepID=UPI00140E521C|nr:ubiquitin carboxyl-terminal hydrolase 17-like [Catharus ustulatus]